MINISIIEKIPAIYKLTCLSTNKIYIGKANNLYKRIACHKNSEKSNKNLYISNVIKKYGWNNFDLEILYEFNKNVGLYEMLSLEVAFIDFFNSTDKEVGYNICKFSNDNTGIKRSEEFKNKLRQLNLGKRHTEETKKKISLNNPRHNLGKKLSDEVKEKLRNYNLGKKHSEITKSKISLGNKGKKRPHTQKWKDWFSKNHPDFSGRNNPCFDFKNYSFLNTETNENFIGTQFDFYKKYNLSNSKVCCLIKGKRKSHKKWILI